MKTPFPPDDRSIGYERANTISKAWDNATTDGAIEAANYVVERFKTLSGDVPLDTTEEQKVKDWCYKFVERAFRRPLTTEQKAYFVDRHFSEAPDRTNAVKRVVLLALKSPRFLYREVGSEKPDQYDVAARLSFGLWDSLPMRSCSKQRLRKNSKRASNSSLKRRVCRAICVPATS